MDGTEATENRLGFDEVAVTPDPLLTKMVKVFRAVPPRHRAHVVAVLESMCTMLRDES